MMRRMLMVEVEKGVMTCQIKDDENRVSLISNLVFFGTNSIDKLLYMPAFRVIKAPM